MQPFDGGTFDQRFDEVIAPSIIEAGLEPYRVDRDADVSIPIDEIEAGIRNAVVCLAEITEDNPNVWFELGYAIACRKEVVLICEAARRARFPFDIQHRTVIRYKTGSPGDFTTLGAEISARLKAATRKIASIATLAASPLEETEGLAAHEIVALATVMQSGLDPDSPPSADTIQRDMAKAGFTELAAAVATKRLMRLGYLDMTEVGGGFNQVYTGFIVTEKGEQWLQSNHERLVLRRGAPESTEDDDDLPF